MSPQEYLATGSTLKWLLAIAWLLPLAGFAVEVFGGYWSDRRSKTAAWLAVGCIATGFVCSAAALVTWGSRHELVGSGSRGLARAKHAPGNPEHV